MDMSKPSGRRTALVTVLATVLAVAAAVAGITSVRAAQTDDVHPHADVKRLGAAHQVAQDIDRRSFNQAIAYYPNAQGDPYSVDMADYLFWKLVVGFQPGARPGRLVLSDFSELCTRQKDAIGPGSSVVCRLAIAVDLTRGDGTTTYQARATVNTGRWFDPARAAYKPTIRAELRGLLDQIVTQLVERMKRGGAPMQ